MMKRLVEQGGLDLQCQYEQGEHNPNNRWQQWLLADDVTLDTKQYNSPKKSDKTSSQKAVCT